MKNESNYLLFVIQKHETTRLHYDFRLQVDEKMISWSIPKGLTLDPAMKRLAMKTDDHAMEYNDFEGVIAEGEVGAGKVSLWDKGEYIPEIEVEKGVLERVESFEEQNDVMKKGLENGMLKFSLFGKKVKGSFALIKTKGFGPRNSWLMIKHKDEHVVVGFDANAV